jgi:glycosyltransferase involved in cell wall biosynthesis
MMAPSDLTSSNQPRHRGPRPDVSIFLHDLRCGGAERVCQTLALEMDRAGLCVEFVLRRAIGELLTELPETIQVHDLDASRVRNALFPLVRYLRRRQPRAVLAALWPLTSLALLARRMAGSQCRVVTSDHCILSQTKPGRSLIMRPPMAAAMRLFYPAADAVVAVSQGVADDVARLAALERDRVRVIFNPITPLPTPRPCDEAILSRWAAGGGPRLIAVANLKAVKDQGTLLRALAVVRQTLDAHLLVLGEGPERSRLEDLARDLGVAGAVTFGGHQPTPHGYISQADVFVMSSRAEGFGNVIVEALACGVPVVSTDCPTGPGEILAHGRFGRLTPVGEPEALAGAILEALDSPPDPAGLRWRAETFSIEQAVSAYREALDV